MRKANIFNILLGLLSLYLIVVAESGQRKVADGMQQRATGWKQTQSAVVRTDHLHMGRKIYQVSYQSAPRKPILKKLRLFFRSFMFSTV